MDYFLWKAHDFISQQQKRVSAILCFYFAIFLQFPLSLFLYFSCCLEEVFSIYSAHGNSRKFFVSFQLLRVK